jgi:hypothetical protein
MTDIGFTNIESVSVQVTVSGKPVGLEFTDPAGRVRTAGSMELMNYEEVLVGDSMWFGPRTLDIIEERPSESVSKKSTWWW